MDLSEDLQWCLEEIDYSSLTELSDEESTAVENIPSVVENGLAAASEQTEAMIHHQLKAWYREIRKMVKAALENKFVANIDIEAYAGHRSLPKAKFEKLYPLPTRFRRLVPGKPRVIVDLKGRPIVWYFPGFLKERSQQAAFGQAMGLAKDGLHILKMTNGDSEGKGGPEHYVHPAGGKAGVAMLVPAWHMTGHPNKQALPSRTLAAPDTVKDCCAIQEFLYAFRDTAQRLNFLLWAINPRIYCAYKELRARIDRRCAATRSAGLYFNSVWMGLSMIFNRRTPGHTDTKGSPWGLDCLLTLGNYRKGDLRLTSLGIDLSYLPGTAVVIYGKVLEHEVLEFYGTQRICAAFFAHRDVLEEVRLDLPDIKSQNCPMSPLPDPPPRSL